ncbi:hypothetical protein [Streptomyces sp. NPDC020489]|uniref:hypothetical protein n=1 Tax=Streptomyces sp. NPDC020489 TaxID=3365077 RepID=UPI00379CB62F
MTYVVTVETCIPEGTPEMDPLQRAGAVALIEDGFDAVRAVEAPGGVQVGILDSIVAVHPEGALLKVFVDAPALEPAEDSVRVLVDELLERSELLADWTIDRCEVELHQDLARKSLDAAEGPDAPPDDPAARKARHTAGAGDEGTVAAGDADAEGASSRGRLLGLAAELRSFPPAVFGVLGAEDDEGDTGGDRFAVAPVSARLAAGALVHATELLVAELFEDVQVLTQEDATVAECEGPLWHLERLPDRYALQYDARFARRFLVTVIAMTTRFTDGGFRRLACVAEGFALRLLIGRATTVLEREGLLDDEVGAALGAFAAHVYADTDHEWLYGDAADGTDEVSPWAGLGVELTAFGSWFTPFQEDRYVHPSAADEPEAAAP